MFALLFGVLRMVHESETDYSLSSSVWYAPKCIDRVKEDCEEDECKREWVLVSRRLPTSVT